MRDDLNGDPRRIERVKAGLASGIARGEAKRVPPLVRAQPDTAGQLADAMDCLTAFSSTVAGSLFDQLLRVLQLFATAPHGDHEAAKLDAVIAALYDDADRQCNALLQALDDARSLLNWPPQETTDAE